MAVYFKFKSAKDYDSIPIEGHFISVGNLKEKIVEKKNLGRGSDFDLVISNAQTTEEYTDEATLVPKNTSVLVRRVPGQPRMPIVADVRDEKVTAEASKDQFYHNKCTEIPDYSLMKQHEDTDWADEFGMDLYTMAEDVPAQPVVNKFEEDNKIRAFVDASAYEWQRQTQEPLYPGRGAGRGSQGRNSGGRGFARVYEKKTPPQGYICHRCGIPGHFIQHCPTNGDPTYDIKKVKPPTGIPKSMLVANPDGFYALPSGGVAVLRPNEAVFEKEIEGLPSSRGVGEIPPELRCPLCGGALKDAVLTSKCCFKSYCDKCIRDQIILKGKCVCGATNVLADDLLPNKTLRDAINRLLEATTATSSAENAGSRYHVQDMESARCPVPKAASPSPSASLKDTVTVPQSDGSNAKGHPVDRKSYFQETHKNAEQIHGHKVLDPLEQESRSARDRISEEEVLAAQSLPQAEDEVQQQMFLNDQVKKKRGKLKRQRQPQGGNEISWRMGPQDFSAEVGMMAYGGNPASYNTYWNQPQWPADAYVPYMGSSGYPYGAYGGPGACEMAYTGAMVAHEAFIPPPFVQAAPNFQRDCMDYGAGTLNSVSGILSREEFEARKAELRKKRELEQRLSNREHAKDLGCDYAEQQGSSKLKRRSSLASSPTKKGRDISPDTHESAERRHLGRVAVSSPSQSGSKRLELKDDMQQREDRKLERINALDKQARQTGADSNGRSEKRSKASVFSRISFPGRSNRADVEKHPDNTDVEADGITVSVGLKRGRINSRIGRSSTDKRICTSVDSPDASKYGTTQSQSSGKAVNGKRISHGGGKEGSRKVYGDPDGIGDDRAVRNRQISNSIIEAHERVLDPSKGTNHKPVRINRERVGLSKA